jgi:PleD family two-component response regulator
MLADCRVRTELASQTPPRRSLNSKARSIGRPDGDAGTVQSFGSSQIGIRCEVSRSIQLRILVVEDDPLIREFVVEALREEGYEVVHAANGEDALEWCGKRIADVLVTERQAARARRRLADRRALPRAGS